MDTQSDIIGKEKNDTLARHALVMQIALYAGELLIRNGAAAFPYKFAMTDLICA